MKLGLMMRPVVHATSARISVAPITHFHLQAHEVASVALAHPHPRLETYSALRRGGCGAPTLLVIAHQLHK